MAKGASRSLEAVLVISAILLVSCVFASPVASASSASPTVKPITLTSPNAQTEGWFGVSVAAIGNLVVVGAFTENSSGYQWAGNAYTFNAKSGALVNTLASPNAQSYGYFGFSVAISTNLIAVGARGETSDGYYSAGNAYVFNAKTGALISMLTSPNPQFNGSFGSSVAVGGDVVAVGAPYESANGYSQAGNAYTFNATTGALIGTLTSPNAQSYGHFGNSVAMSGSTIVVGAFEEKGGGARSAGHAYIFNATTGALTNTLTSPNAQRNGQFGASVTVVGSLVAVGAPQEASHKHHSLAGNAYTFNSTTGALISTLSSPNKFLHGYFGYSVAVSGNKVVVGAPFQFYGHIDPGYAYVFNAKTGALVSTLSSPKNNRTGYGFFGWSAAASGNVIVIGAPDETANGFVGAGHSYIFGD